MVARTTGGGGGRGTSILASGLFDAECLTEIGFFWRKLICLLPLCVLHPCLSEENLVDMTSVRIERIAELEFHMLRLLLMLWFNKFLSFLFL
jgi:hypothetical protein